jgi:iron complex outermembrane receptor protein
MHTNPISQHTIDAIDRQPIAFVPSGYASSGKGGPKLQPRCQRLAGFLSLPGERIAAKLRPGFPLFAGLLVMCSLSAVAQTEDSLGLSRREHALQPVEVRALRAGDRTPFAKTDISAQEIEKLNQGQDIPYLLQYTPSAVTTSDAGAGIGYSGLRIRGTDGSRINVTLNGIPVNDAESQGVFFVNLPDLASSTGSLQVQRGVGTSTNGVGAFGAAISVNNMDQMEKAGAEGSFSFGSFNTQRYTVKAGTGLLSNGLQFDVRLSKISTDGFIERSASDLKSLQLLAGWKASERTQFRFLMLTGTEKTGQAWNGVPEDSLRTNRRYNELGRKADGTYYDDQTDNYQQDYYQLFADHKINPYLTAHLGLFLTRGRGYYQEYRLGEAFGDYYLPDFTTPAGDTLTETDMIRQLWLDNKHYGSVFSLFYERNKTALTLGGSLARYEGYHYGFVKWAEYGVPADHRWYHLGANKNDVTLYGKAQQTLGRALVLFGDLQYRYVGYRIDGFRKNPTLHPEAEYHFFNPKAGLSYFLRDAATDRQRVYASVAAANKEPNRDDFENAAQQQPRPERLLDVEGGYEIRRRNWEAGANLYFMDYKDQLILTGQINDVGAYARTNVASSYRAGLELQGGWQPLYWLKATANATFSENKIRNFTEYMDDYDEGGQRAISHGTTDIAFSPAVIGTGVLSFTPFRNLPHGQRIGLDVFGKYVGMQYLDNTGDASRSIDPYALCDLRLHYGIKAGPFREATLTLAVNNVFNRQYESNGYTYSYVYGGTTSTFNYYFPQAGTNWLLGLNLKW